MPSLTRDEARERAALVQVTSYDVELDLTGGDDPGRDTFGSRTVVRFGCASPGAGTFLDVKAAQVDSITLNGRAVDPTGVADGRVRLEGLAADNEVVVQASMTYRTDGQGLHRSVDPEDGQAYVYGHLFLDAAPRVFACFDQPDLKAALTLRVQAPPEWTVLGNGAATSPSPGRWELAVTRPLATYFVTVCAGPWVSVTAEHDGVPLGLHARASLRPALERHAERMLQVTRDALDHYHAQFGIRYPFGDYHQVFVPEFNAGAMENPGCVTFRDDLLFRGAATDDELLGRDTTIAHEMAHMWFGDLVTMRWWDDLWLNESFAEFLAHRTVAATTGSDDVWVAFTVSRKTWGYAAERTPSTHPVAGRAPDADAALQNFDGISYAKGAAVLRQLMAHLGEEVFRTGLTAYLHRHASGNASLEDLLAALGEVAGRDLTGWAGQWLGTAGVDTLRVETDGPVLRVRRETPEEHPADRPHTLDVAVWRGAEQVALLPLTLDGPVAEVPAPGLREGDLVVPNASDLTWARVALRPEDLPGLATTLPEVDAAQHRAVVWAALVDGTAVAEVDPRRVVEVFAAAWPREDDVSVLSQVGAFVTGRLLGELLPGEALPEARRAVGEAAVSVLRDGTGPRVLPAARVLAEATDDGGLLRRWAQGQDLPGGLAGDRDFRWTVVRGLAVLGETDQEEIERIRLEDGSMRGNLGALTALAALPDGDVKERVWSRIAAGEGSNYELNALASGFWRGRHHDLVRPYRDRYLTDLPALTGRVGQDALGGLAWLAFPTTLVEEDTAAATRARLHDPGLSAAVRRAMVDRLAVLEEALASRRAFG